MKPSEHAVLVHVRLSDEKFGAPNERTIIASLEERLEARVKAESAGDYDGHEIGMGYCTLFLYGPDADVLFSAIEPILREGALADGSYAIKRYGAAADPNAKETRVQF